jgi:hypothetical protein
MYLYVPADDKFDIPDNEVRFERPAELPARFE